MLLSDFVASEGAGSSLVNIFGAPFNIYGEHFTFTGRVSCVITNYRAVTVTFGEIKLIIKLARTILNFRGILPQTDRHNSFHFTPSITARV